MRHVWISCLILLLAFAFCLFSMFHIRTICDQAIVLLQQAQQQAAQYDFSALDGLYEALGSTLGQALETASSAEETTLQKLYAAISGTGVTLSYPAAIPSGVRALSTRCACLRLTPTPMPSS